jgi:hypothetical protein
MSNGWRERLPDPVLVPLDEVRSVIAQLDREITSLAAVGDGATVDCLEAVIGRMTRWTWDLL